VLTIAATNNGPDAAAGVSITNNVPAGTIFASVSSTAGVCTAPGGTGTVTCNGFSLSSGSSATVTLTLNVTAAPKTKFRDTAKVSATTLDQNSTNNQASVTVTVN